MKSKLIFRILGALASALIIASVFVPFVSVTGYSVSLWDDAATMNTLYLPIMIIVFGAIGVIFFALNIKTEFAYMSAGAITFFGVVETIDILNQGSFEVLSIGYYFLIVGAVLTALMAFITNLKPKKKVGDVVPVEQKMETSMLDQIDKLYNEQPIQQNQISPIQPIDNVVSPIPVQPMETFAPVQPIEQINPIVQQQPQPEIVQVQPQQVVEQPVQVPTVSVEPIQQPVNPVVQEFSNTPVQQPVVQEFSNTPVRQPVVQEFSTPQVNLQPEIPVQPVLQEQPEIAEPISNVAQPISVNPVIQEFTNPGAKPQSNTNDLDIFGQ